jgi:hypothetical protein
MVERMYKKGLVVGIIILFIGVGVQSAFAFNTNISSNEKNISDDDFFNKLTIIDSFHDVGIKNITSPKIYNQPGTEKIEVIVENNGTFPEYGLTCYAEIWEYITDPINGSLFYEDNITDIDLEEPTGGTKTLNFKDFTFAYEGIYCLYVDLPLEIDDFPENNQRAFVIGVDDTKPVSSHTLNPPYPDGENGWYVSDVEVALTAYDPYSMKVSSGIDMIQYRVNGGPVQTIEGDNGTFLITETDEGSGAFVEYWAIDNVGNVETRHLLLIYMDQTAPTTDLTYEVIGGNPWQGWVFQLALFVWDSGSGVNYTYYRIDGGEWILYTGPFILSGDEIFIEYYSVDFAGNVGWGDANLTDFIDFQSSGNSHIYRDKITSNMLLFRLLERFPLLQQLLDVWRSFIE